MSGARSARLTMPQFRKQWSEYHSEPSMMIVCMPNGTGLVDAEHLTSDLCTASRPRDVVRRDFGDRQIAAEPLEQATPLSAPIGTREREFVERGLDAAAGRSPRIRIL